MRAHGRCPKCNGTRFYVVDNHQCDPHSANTTYPFAITSVLIAANELGSQQKSRYRTDVGGYDTWICAQCAYTEWYARDPEQLLAKLAARHDGGVRLVDSAASGRSQG